MFHNRVRTASSVDALRVDAIERGAGRVVAVGATSRRADADSGSRESSDSITVAVGTGGDSHDSDSKDYSDSEGTHVG